jgi:phosphotransferase system HPr (HPr) family protein
MPMACRQVYVKNKLGLHARPAMQFVDRANQFQAAIRVRKSGQVPVEADGKSVMQMLVLEATEGTSLMIEADGADAETAVVELAKLFENRFGEE